MKIKVRNFFAIFISRASPLIIGLVILPFYKRYGSATEFDAISIIFVIQSLAILLDAGISQNAMRLSAITEQKDSLCYIYLTEQIKTELTKHYIKIGAIFFLYLAFFSPSINISQSIGISISLYFISKNNILQSSLIGAQKYTESALIQLLSNLTRQIFLLGIFIYINQSIELNVWLNLLCLIGIDFLIFKFLNRKRKHEHCCKNVDKNIKSYGITIATISGALAMQGDKLLVGALCQPGELGNYYLAQIIACIPLLFVSTPVSQYFQPKLFGALSENNIEKQILITNNFIASIFFICVIPSTIGIWLMNDFLNVWIGHGNHVEIIRMSSILLLGTIPGCFGYIFHGILSYKTDFSFLAKASLALTTIVLLATYIFARSNLTVVAIGYAMYHILSVLILIARIKYKFPQYLYLLNKRSLAFIGISLIAPLILFGEKFDE
jgi:O-antigen/teichoic acid export membrane protein